MVVPDALGGPHMPTALWGDVAVSLPVCLYEAYGDAESSSGSTSRCGRYIDQVAELLDERGVWGSGFQFGDWVDPDAPPGNPGGGKADRHLIATAFLAAPPRSWRAPPSSWVAPTMPLATTPSTIGSEPASATSG